MTEKNEYKQELSEDGSATDVEFEANDVILEPFNPEQISIEQKPVAMDTLIRRLKQGSIKLAPNFQRNEVWNLAKKSQLIESIMLMIPLPMFYVAARDDGHWEVVDGLQRLSSIRDFILGDSEGAFLRLNDLEFLGSIFNGKTFKQIEDDRSFQRTVNTIMETEMRFTVINPGTPEEVKLNIFKRINTGGMPLTSQEIRHALYQGQASELLSRLVNKKEFITAVGSHINDTRMVARELILRYISFTLFTRDSYKSNMDLWLSNTMRVINVFEKMTTEQVSKIFENQTVPVIRVTSIREIEVKFQNAMLRANALFGEFAFRKSLPGDLKKSPINKALFETWSNILCELTDDEFSTLCINKAKLVEEYRNTLSNDAFLDSISRHAAQATRGVEFRYGAIEKLVQNIIKG